MNKSVYPHPLRSRIRAGELVLGSVLSAPTVSVAAQTCGTGIDFLWIDTEHQPYGVEAMDAIPGLARLRGVAPMIRVAWNDPHLIKKAYDSGAVAVMIPQITTAGEAARAVQFARYPPLGQRGVSPNWPSITGDDWGNVVRTANEETVLVLQIESEEAYRNLDEIARVPGIDVLFAGPMDLSASLGIITQVQDPRVQDILRDIPRRLKGTGIATGTTLVDVAELQQKMSWGYRFLNVGSPLGYGLGVLQGHLGALRATPLA
ncbi:MAG: aldolase/citrate lyase family protein [Thermoflexales bacterium]